MSSLIFPTGILGQSWDGDKTPMWKTGLQEALSGKASSIAYQQYPQYEWTLKYELLRHDVTPSELKKLMGLFNAMRGRFDTFLFTDPTFNTVVDEPFGTGDGTTVAFPITATFQNVGGPGLAELIQNFNGAVTIKDNGGTVSGANYTLGPTGIVTFNTAPVAAHALTWSGSFFYRCRFMTDSQSFSEFMNQWWACKSMKFRSFKL